MGSGSVSSMRSILREFQKSPLNKFLVSNAFWLGLLIRFAIAWILPRWMDHTDVPYTDIDYHIFTEAAEYVQRGQSPYNRQTYRYTPFLAVLLRCLPCYKTTSRYLFCFADVLVGHLLPSPYYWTYNPLAINISTRGSAESFLVLLPVLATMKLVQAAKQQQHSSRFLRCSLFAGFLQGLSIHLKLYPLLYTLAFMLHLTRPTELPFRQQWLVRLFQPAPLLFVLTAVATFALLTLVTYQLYGHTGLHQSLLYHLQRLDHRHNYSPWWYPIYTANVLDGSPNAATTSFQLETLTKLSMGLPQLILVVAVSLGIPHLPTTLFFLTYLFVTFNRVITAQYFTWYLVFLGFIEFDSDKNHRADDRLLQSALLWIASVVLWLLSAYGLEMRGWATHRYVWMASIAHQIANVQLLRALLGKIRGGAGGGGAKQTNTKMKHE